MATLSGCSFPILIAGIEGPWEIPKGKVPNVRAGESGSVHHDDLVGERLIGCAEEIGRLHDYDLGLRGL